MLEIKNQEHLDQVKVFAERVGLLKQLEGKLKWLEEYGGKGENKAVLMPDVVGGYNFIFNVYGRDPRTGFIDKFRFNGGLIYYSCGDSGVGSPQFSVRLDASEAGWEIHT